MKTYLLGLFCLVAISFSSYGQQWEAEMLKPNANFYAIQNAFNNEWANKPYEKGAGYKQFKRWENFWETRTMPDGSFPMNHKSIWDSFKSTLLGGPVKSGGIGDWSPIGPFDHVNTDSWSPGSGRVNCIVEDPNNSAIIYIGSPAGGVWKSTDSGSTWTPLGDELSVIGVSGIAVDPNNSNIIYLATGDSDAGDTYSIGLMKSIDGGTTWNEVGGISANETTEIIIDPSNSNTLWLATSVGVLKSIDAGLNWTNSLSGNYTDIALKPGTPNTIYAVDSDDFFVSTNGGTSWSNTTTGLPTAAGRIAIAVTPANTSYVYLLISNTDWSYNGVYRSNDSGSSFTPRNTTTDVFESTQAWYDMAIAVSPTNANTVITGVLNVWRSTNGGTSFSGLNSWSNPGGAAYTHADIHYLKYYNGNLYCGSDGGIYKSTNNGTNFTDITAGLQIGQFYRLGASQNDVTTLSGGLQDNGGYAYVGGTWKVYYGADGMEAGVDGNNSNIIFGMIQNGSLYRSTNGGNTSSGQGSPESGRWVTPMQMDPNNDRLLAGYNDLHEFDYASGWNQISTFNFPELLRSIEIYDANSDIIFCGTDDNIYRTTNGGGNFTDITGSLSSVAATITSIEVNPTDSDEIWVTFGGWSAANHVYHTTNGGANWNNITGALPNLPCNIVKYDPAGAGGIYVGTDIGVYFRDNVSSVWVQYMNNLPNVIVNDLEINYNANVIRAATYGRGVWESGVYTISDYDVGISDVSSPEDTYCNINSFDPEVTLTNYGALEITSATITYDIDGGVPQIYNWTGSLLSGDSEVITLSNVTSTSGAHTFNVATSLPNGVADQEPNNDSKFKDFVITMGAVLADFLIIPDCWGAEITWEILDGGGAQVLSGGPYSDGTGGIPINESLCIQPACYDFIIYDGYGDGMYGSQYGSCTIDGYYNLTDAAGDTLMEIIAVNSDYGSVENNSFCITSTLSANFTASSTTICEGETVDFTDLSFGTPNAWDWTFVGGTVGTSTDQNPLNITYNTPGSYDVELIVGDGIINDTIVIVDYITVNAITSGSANVTTCDSYTWSGNGATYTSSGSFSTTLVNSNGCDSIATLNLTITNSTAGSANVSACNSYTWSSNGQTYTSSGSYSTTLTNAAGCDSIATLNLNVSLANSGSQSVTACESYTWAATGNTYTSSGSFATTLTNAGGCDSTATLNLTITNNSSSTQNESACNTYTWPLTGNTYTSSGLYTTTIPNAAGCDSIITLNLAINTDVVGSDNITACGSYLWPANGNTYTSTGSYTALLTSAAGCDSTATLNLTISTTAATSQNVSTCGPYTWAPTGLTYSSNGSYSTTLTSSTGCDSTVTLNLMINSANAGSASVMACDNYTWSANGTNYTSTGMYTTTLTNVNGCDSIATLDLTITNSIVGATETVSACNMYTWAANGNTYSTSGLYSTVVTSSQGCDSTIMLDLTVNNTNSGSANVIACDSYVWSANGNTYTATGSYVAMLTNANGCDSTATLNLTVNSSNSSLLNVVECGSYAWAADGNSYFTSGVYTAVLTNANGCDSIATLDLTINEIYSLSETVTACDSYTWAGDGNTYTNTGMYTASYLSSEGCDSTMTLDLTINSVNSSATQLDEITMEADQAAATYQWLDCDNSFGVIAGETNQSYVASANGNYAVEVTANGCVDTSACMTISQVSVNDIEFESNIKVYPNPTSGEVKIDLGDKYEWVNIKLYNVVGQLIRVYEIDQANEFSFLINGATGSYIVEILTSKNETTRVKVLKE